MALFPLALAIEPRLLPCAIANGFSMDYKVINSVREPYDSSADCQAFSSIETLSSEKCLSDL